MRTQFQVIRNLRVPSPRPDVVVRLLSVFIRRRSLRPCPYGGATRMVGEGRRGSRRAKQREWDLARARREGWRNCQCYIGSLHVRTSLCTGITSANRLSSGHLQLPQPGELSFLFFSLSFLLSLSLSSARKINRRGFGSRVIYGVSWIARFVNTSILSPRWLGD